MLKRQRKSRRSIRVERLESRHLLAVGLLPIDTAVTVDTVSDDLTITGSASIRFDAVILNPELNGPEDYHLTNLEISSTGQLGGQVDGFDITGSWQTDPNASELELFLDEAFDQLLVESVGPTEIPGTFEALVSSIPVSDGIFKATLGSALDFFDGSLSGSVFIEMNGSVLGGAFSESADAPFTQPNVLPAGLPFPDPDLKSVSGRVFLDDNGNGIRDGSETGTSGLTAVLLQESIAVESMPVDADGYYGFYNLSGDNYQIRIENLPSGKGFTLLNAGTDATLDSDIDPSTGATTTLDFDAAVTQLNIDAGLRNLESDGISEDTIGLYQPDISLFHLKESFSPGASDQYVAFGPGGAAGWIPLVGDWDGDGVDTIGLYQPDISLFHLKNSATPGASDVYFAFGPAGDAGWVPLVGDWNGDGIDTIGLYQPDISLFHLKDSFTPGASDQYFAFGPDGDAGWTPLAGDWNGDGTDTVGLYQPDISLFHLKDTFTPGASDQYFAFGPGGSAGWVPLPGDWDGDGADSIGLYQPDISLFHLKNTFTPGASDQYFAFGPAGDAGWIPLVGDWNGPESVIVSGSGFTSTVAVPGIELLESSTPESELPSSSPLATQTSERSSGGPEVSGELEGELVNEEADLESDTSSANPLELLDEAFSAW